MILIYYLISRGCKIVVAWTQSDSHERYQMVDTELYGWIFGGGHVEQSILYEYIDNNYNM